MARKIASVVLVGRPNVGKSTLFNRMTGSRRAIVAPIAGTTRDSLARPVAWRGATFELLDTGGLYGASHLPLAYLEKATGPLRLRHLPTSGGGPAIVAVLGNNAQVTTQTVSATLSHVRAGKLRPLANFGETRSKSLPDVPTLKELGFDVEYYLWVGIFAPKGTPAAIVTTLRAAIGQAVQSEQFKVTLVNIGLELAYLDGPDFQKFWDIDGRRTD